MKTAKLFNDRKVKLNTNELTVIIKSTHSFIWFIELFDT